MPRCFEFVFLENNMTMKRKLKNSIHRFLELASAIRYKYPSRELFVIGVTGTSGKSTTVFLLRQMLEQAGYTVGSLSTIDFSIAGEKQLNDRKMTMLGRGENQRFLREMVSKGCDVAIVETSSEGALQHRHRFINYDTFVFTNLYPEHIEAHGSFENYKKTKLDILRHVAKQKKKFRFGQFVRMQVCQLHECPEKERVVVPKTIIAPLNSDHAEDVLSTGFDGYYLFGRNDIPVYASKKHIEAAAGVAFANHIQVTPTGIALTFEKRSVIVPMYGEHNAQNVLAVAAAALSLGIPWHTIFETISKFHNVPGRVEFIEEAGMFNFQVIVDYAFEPVAMAALYEVVDLLKPTRVIHVCSSTGGGRDVSRRDPIGRMAGSKADIVIVTDEDPYDEDPMRIIEAVAAGALAVGKKEGSTLFKILDRAEAIAQAVALAKQGDLVLVTGKGSEQAMCLADGKMIPWDDRTLVRKSLREMSH